MIIRNRYFLKIVPSRLPSAQYVKAADHEKEPDEAEPKDDELTVDPFIIGGAMGFAYEEGLRERKRRKRKKLNDDSE